MDWGRSFSECSGAGIQKTCVMQAPLSALLTRFPLSYPGLQLGDSQHELVQCYLKCSSFFHANALTAFALIISPLML